ncbi:hypothetical protein DFH11DRAFT_1201077 [Phellopilus nigrolimitatus]|nr:hypothetical protein DFH11DRAFT_1201077 [Phellopilus nigrolimitatus]
MPLSPTTSRRGTKTTRSPRSSPFAGTGFLGYPLTSGAARPSTPPPSFSGYLEGSLTMTPIAKRNPPTTPTRSIARFKSSRPAGEDITGGDEQPTVFDAIPRTPSRRPAEVSSGAGPSNFPETPRRIFSPFGTFSPFRTPSRRGIFDPADPGTMLDEELSALASAKQRGPPISPVGFFPHGKGLLYESPNLPSPDKWRPW